MNGNPVTVKSDQTDGSAGAAKQLSELKRPKSRSLNYSPYYSENSKGN